MNINRTLGPILATILWISPVAGAADLTLQVQGLDAPSGTLHVALFDEAGWSDNAAIDSAIVEIDDDAPEIVFEGLAPGPYGVKLFQDLDGDGMLGRGPMGIPREPYGFSNDAPVRFGPPSFARAGFDLPAEGATQTITLR
ncbi:DUF2141 domain-containing protein [Hyphomonas sp.]|uniref:DUF2141 domain-containing protein n=1 Tax=Hyphomonas sp. TaxID=87 RepID=UPI00300315C9